MQGEYGPDSDWGWRIGFSLRADMRGVVRTRMFIVAPKDADNVGRAHKELFGEARPVATMVVVAGLLDPEWRVEIEVEAIAR